MPRRAAQAGIEAEIEVEIEVEIVESNRRRRAKGFANNQQQSGNRYAATAQKAVKKRGQRAAGINDGGIAYCGRHRHRWRARLCDGN
jgi:hypothetical protein